MWKKTLFYPHLHAVSSNSLNQKNTKLDDLLDQGKHLNAALDKCKSLEESCEKLEKRVERLVNQGHDIDLTIENKRAEFKLVLYIGHIIYISVYISLNIRTVK